MSSEINNTSKKSIFIFGDYLLMLIFPCAVSIWYYGLNAAKTLAVCIFTGFVFDFIFSLLIYKKYFAADLSTLCSSIMIALMMPSDISAYIPAFACGFAVAVIKIPFGGGMKAPFVPAASGFAFAAVCFKEAVFSYPAGRGSMFSTSIAYMLSQGRSMKMTVSNFLDIIIGNVRGPMGTGCILIFIACIVFLLIRRREALIATAGFLFTCLIFALVFPRSEGSLISSAVLELSAGSLFFASVFLLTDYSTLPRYKRDKLVYGIFCGVICMVMRRLAAFEEPVCFAVLLANAFSPLLDILTKRIMNLFSFNSHKKEAFTDVR